MSIATKQMPGVYRRKVGDVLVTALLDGHLVIPVEALQGVDAAEMDSVMRAGGRRPPFTSSINAFLLQWGGKTVLVDTGASDLMGPIGGKLPESLAAAGVAAGEVDAVLLTHLHVDHAGGLVNPDGGPAFPNAELVVAEVETAYWHDDAARAAAPEGRRAAFDTARRAVAPYASRTRRFGGGEVMPGVMAVPLPGHTPGHTGFMIGSGGDSLLIWGDICHIPVLQAARPGVTLMFDSDPAQAEATRRGILERAVAEDLLVTGMHMSFPGFARIARGGEGYVVQPDVWAELPSQAAS